MKQEDRVRDYFTRDARRFDRVYAAGRQQTGVQRLVDAFFRRRELRQRVGACVQAVGEAGRVLEIGSGSGRVAVALVQAGVRHITGIDLSQELCRLAQGLAEQAGLADRCEFLVGSAEAFEAEEPFDAVVVLGLMDYVADAPAMLARTKRLSRRRVVVSFPRRGMLLNLPRRLCYDGVPKTRGPTWPHIEGPDHEMADSLRFGCRHSNAVRRAARRRKVRGPGEEGRGGVGDRAV